VNYYHLIKNFVPQNQIENIIKETFSFKKTFYTQENLACHAAYLSDTHPNRTSHAYATSLYYNGELPFIDLFNVRLENLVDLHRRALGELGLSLKARILFNVQEYFSSSEVVPKHHDGELLDFSIDNGNLDIKRSIRPDKVAVLTLVNDTDGGGTRIYLPDGTEEVVAAQAGDLLIFDNASCKHGVDPLVGTVKREDGLLRLIIGWRSLNEKTSYNSEFGNAFLNTEDAEAIIGVWYKTGWPKQWERIQNSQQKAAF
jgi:hypothetical protein